MSIYETLSNIQVELKAHKNLYNSFGKYKYRNAESILEAAKPLCAKHGCTLTVSDEVILIGNRYYIKATATVQDKDGNAASTTALAREDETKKGMDGAQITGTASSYARKYALNGLFCIDDTKDPDSDEYHNQTAAAANAQDNKTITETAATTLPPAPSASALSKPTARRTTPMNLMRGNSLQKPSASPLRTSRQRTGSRASRLQRRGNEAANCHKDSRCYRQHNYAGMFPQRL